MRRIRSTALLAVACLAGALAFLAAPATAQTGYPPGPCDVLSGTQFAGNVTVGQTFTVTVAPVCLFTPGSTANIVVNGAAPFTKTVNPDGTVTLTITVVSASELSVNPIVPAVCGLNTIRVSAPSDVADDRVVTQNVTFNLICPGEPVPPGGDVNICTGGDGGPGGPGLGVDGGTGAGGVGGAGGDACNVNLVGGPGGAGGPGGPGGAGAPGAPGAPGQSGASKSLLARTGSTVAPFLVAAFALVLVGTALTLTARRRRGAFR